MSGQEPPTLTAEDHSAADYLLARLANHDLPELPTHPFDRWLWLAHGVVDWRLADD